MNRPTVSFPDISDILERKAEGRRDIATRSFAEKIEMVEKMRERLEPLKQLRQRRQAVTLAPKA